MPTGRSRILSILSILTLLALLVQGCGLTSKDTSPAKGEFTKLKVYAATGQGLAFSSDSGSAWQHFLRSKTNGLADNHLDTLAIISDNNFWVGTVKGLSMTTDNAKTWVSYTVENGLGGNEVRDILFSNKTLYAATNGGLSISTDNATTWMNISTKEGLPSDLINSILLDGNNLYLGTEKGFCVSTDNARNWTVHPVSGNIVRRLFIKADKLYVCSDQGLFAASKNSTLLSKVTAEGSEEFLNRPANVFFIDNEGTWWLGTEQGLARSNNQGKGWRIYDESDGLEAFTVNDIAVNGAMVFAATDRGLAVSNDSGESWVTYNKDEGLKSLTLKRIVVR